MSNSSVAPKGSASGASAALDGYEYQLDVSIYAALRLLLITKSATRITLEPANEEDLDADLEPAAPGRVVPSANVADGYKLVVQVKLRNSGPWSVAAFDALLKHGKKRRPARHHLDDPGTRFLLISNADATGVARDLLVAGLEEWPDEADFPSSLGRTLPNDPEGRVAIWGQLTERLVDLEIDEILITLLRVSRARLIDCRALLREESRRRMRGTSPGVWTREDLLATIRSCGGYLASAPELEAFVPPANYDAMVARLERQNAIVITGPSGTGKTWTALALCDLVRRRQTGLEIINVNVNNDPSSTRALIDTGPTLHYIEDPWGQYSLRGGSEAWTEQLPRLLREARPGHQYVITSRTDMLGSANAESDLKRWSVVLDADQYREGELARIYDKRLDLLATELQAKALDFRREALSALETPLELDLFFAYLADGPEPDEVDHAFYRRIVQLAHRDAVEGVVVRYLTASQQAGCAAIVWAFLASRSQFDRSQLTALQRQIRTLDRSYGDLLDKLVNRLVATRHLRQPIQTVSFAHPSVRAGFEQFIAQNWATSEMALELLISALTQIAGPQRKWALETAARTLDAIADLIRGSVVVEAPFVADGASQVTIDKWLEDGLVDPRADFRALLQLASDVGSEASTPSELSRWFIKGVRRGGQFFVDDWDPPSFGEEWYDRVFADPRSVIIADRFIREQLPQEQSGFGDDFSRQLDRIATGLTPAFLAAAKMLVGAGFDRNIGPVAFGAIRDIVRYEDVLDAALDELARLHRSYEDDGQERWRAIQDGECDAAYEEGFQSGHEDDGYAAGKFISVYVTKVRSSGRWQSLVAHPRASELARPWAESLSRSPGPISPDELRAVITATRLSDDEDDAWDAVRQHWDASMEPDLEERIMADCSDQRLRDALAHCSLSAAPQVLLRSISQLAAAPGRLVRLLVDVHAAQCLIDSKDRPRRLRPILTALPSEAAEVFRALPFREKPAKPVGPAALSLLELAATTAGPHLLGKIVPVMIASGAVPADAINRWLFETHDSKLACAAAEAAIRIGDDALVRRALCHGRADAREAAIKYLAAAQPDPIPSDLLDFASDPGSRVRRALVTILKGRTHPAYLGTLIKLTSDDWSDAEPHHDEPPSYPIARDAVAALGAYGALSDEIGAVLVALAERTDDRLLSSEALTVAAKHCGPGMRAKIWTLSFIDQPRWVRVDAIDALIMADVVEREILDAVTAKLILRLAPPLAASATILLAAHGSVEVAVTTMERIAHSTRHRALLLVGAWALAARDRGAAAGLLELLDPNHPAKRLLDLGQDELLPNTVLDNLGDARIRKAVRHWLKYSIMKD